MDEATDATPDPPASDPPASNAAPTDTKPTDTKPTDANPTDANPTDTKPSDPTRRSSACLDCGTERVGRFCHGCGQKEVVGKLHLLDVLRQAWQQFVDIDRGFLHTFTRLWRGPGVVAAEYADGLRTRHCPPLRYFLIWVTIAILTPVVLGMDVLGESRTLAAAELAKEPGAPAALPAWLDAAIVFIQKYQRVLALAAVPLHALATWAVTATRGRTYAEHLVFVLYAHGQYLLVVIATMVLRRFDIVPWLHLHTSWLLVGYMIWGLQHFVAEPWWRIVLKLIVALVVLAIASCTLGAAILLLGPSAV